MISVAMDGTQWTNEALGRDLDQSVLLASFFGTLPPEPGYVEFDMSKLAVLQKGASDKSGAGFWSVHRLQVLLAETGKLSGVGPAKGLRDDGEFGAATAAAVKAVQAHYGITQDACAARRRGASCSRAHRRSSDRLGAGHRQRRILAAVGLLRTPRMGTKPYWTDGAARCGTSSTATDGGSAEETGRRA